MKDRSAWKDCSELEDEHENGLRATKTALRSRTKSMKLDDRSTIEQGKPI